MSVLELHTIPVDALIRNDASSLCVFDPAGELVADYDFCTGLRLLISVDGITVYVNDDDLVPGRWVLLLSLLDDGQPRVDRVEGFKAGPPAGRHFVIDYPWADCGPGERLSAAVRQARLLVCEGCEFLDVAAMTCEKSGKAVLDATTRAREFCPEDYWGDKQQVVDAINEQAQADGIVPEAVPTAIITAEDQAAFEVELDAFLGGM